MIWRDVDCLFRNGDMKINFSSKSQKLLKIVIIDHKT